RWWRHVTFELHYPQSLSSGNQESSMALTGRCRLRGRGIPMETEFGRIMSSRSDRAVDWGEFDTVTGELDGGRSSSEADMTLLDGTGARVSGCWSLRSDCR
ncbi:unnamed protein product, partial [Pleuronectes platessa]